MKVDLSKEESRSQFELPPASYTLRVLKSKWGESKKKNLMFTIDYEIIEPEFVLNEGKRVPIAGTEVTSYYAIAQKGPKYAAIKDLYIGLGLPEDSFDNENPDTEGMVGRKLKAICSSEKKAKIDGNTGEPIVDNNGNAVFDYQLRVGKILGPVTE